MVGLTKCWFEWSNDFVNSIKIYWTSKIILLVQQNIFGWDKIWLIQLLFCGLNKIVLFVYLFNDRRNCYREFVDSLHSFGISILLNHFYSTCTDVNTSNVHPSTFFSAGQKSYRIQKFSKLSLLFYIQTTQLFTINLKWCCDILNVICLGNDHLLGISYF